MSKHEFTNKRQPFNTVVLTPTQIGCMTKFTRDGVRDMTNRKPYRTKAQKLLAEKKARKCSDGAYRSSAPVSWHM